MLFSAVILSFIATLVTAAPTPIDDSGLLSKRSPEDIQLKDGNVLIISDSTEKRSPESVQLKDGSFLVITDSEGDANATNVRQVKRSDGIKNCGPRSGWMPVADTKSTATGTWWWGFNSAVDEFCQRASYDSNGNPIIIASKKKASLTVRHQSEFDSTSIQVGLKGSVPGHIVFEIDNQHTDAEYSVADSSCAENLKKLSAAGQSCYGTTNKDTKGGKYELDSVSFQALPASG